MIKETISNFLSFISGYFKVDLLFVGIFTIFFCLQVIRGGLHITESRVSHQPIQERWKFGPARTTRFAGEDAESIGKGYILGGILGILFGLLIIWLSYWIAQTGV